MYQRKREKSQIGKYERYKKKKIGKNTPSLDRNIKKKKIKTDKFYWFYLVRSIETLNWGQIKFSLMTL